MKAYFERFLQLLFPWSWNRNSYLTLPPRSFFTVYLLLSMSLPICVFYAEAIRPGTASKHIRWASNSR